MLHPKQYMYTYRSTNAEYFDLETTSNYFLVFFSHLFVCFHLQDGEEVRFNIEVDASGRKRAADVTGPDGGFVQGAPKRSFQRDDFDDRY